MLPEIMKFSVGTSIGQWRPRCFIYCFVVSMSFSLLGILMLEALQEFSVSGMDSTGGAAASELSVQQTNRNGTRTILANLGYFLTIFLQTDGFQMKMTKMRKPRSMLMPLITLKNTWK